MWKSITKMMHPLKLVRTVITSSQKVMILNAMWKQCMKGSKKWHLKLALEHLWERKKWKFQNSFSAVNASESKLVHISLLPSVEHFTVKRNIPLNKKNFKKKSSIWYILHVMYGMVGSWFSISNCNLFESWSQRLREPSEPLGLGFVRALEQVSLWVRKAPLMWASELEMSLWVPS